MADLLSSIGLTSGTPDPTAFLKQKEVSDQLNQAKSAATSTLGTIGFALDAAKGAGISPSLVSNLETLKAKATTLTEATNMTPAQMEAERTKLELEFAKTKAAKEEAERVARLTQIQDVLPKIAAERKLVEADATLPADMKDAIRVLDETGQKALKATQEAVTKKQEIPPTVETGNALADTLQDLIRKREMFENKTPSGGSRGLREGLRKGALAIMILVLIAAAVLGGSVLANTFIDEVFWGIRLYYFIYGAIGFPLSLLYGVIRPPVWQATILPWTMVEDPNASGISSAFSYHLFTAEELDQLVGTPPIPRKDVLERSRSVLRWMSLGGLLASATAVGIYVSMVA